MSVQLSTAIADGGVLPADQLIWVEGTDAPGALLDVAFGAQSWLATAKPDGSWRVAIGPFEADDAPRALVINSFQARVGKREAVEVAGLRVAATAGTGAEPRLSDDDPAEADESSEADASALAEKFPGQPPVGRCMT